jgi:hypothetical protein
VIDGYFTTEIDDYDPIRSGYISCATSRLTSFSRLSYLVNPSNLTLRTIWLVFNMKFSKLISSGALCVAFVAAQVPKGKGGGGMPKGGGIPDTFSGGSAEGPAPKGGSCQGDIAGGMSSLGGDGKYARTDGSGGSGPYKAAYTTDPGLRRHTIYLPKSIPEGIKLPVVIWGNGACYGKGLLIYLTHYQNL